MRDISKTDTPGQGVTPDLERDVGQLKALLTGFSKIRPLRDPIADALEEMGCTGPQLHSILALGAEGPLTMGELGRRLGVTDKTMTGLVDRLERDGHVHRERDENDRRVVRVKLTRPGTTLFRKMEAHIHERMTHLLGLLDTRDRRDLFRILHNLMSRLAELRSVSESGTDFKEGKQS